MPLIFASVLPWVLALLALVVALVVLTYFIRLLWVLRFTTFFICSVRIPGQRWKRGFARYQNTELLWYSLYSSRLSPNHRWQRSRIEFGHGRERIVDSGERWLALPVSYPDGDFELFLPEANHSALVAWVEALPPHPLA
ncbi:MAG: DUF2550 family protein [Varibaculum sp.]|nr:DUF2550 family protein [Varibaculum sp.]